MGMVGLAGAVADPDHVAGGGVPVARGRIDARHRLLEAEEQGFVAGEEIGRAELRHGLGIDAAGPHEGHGFGDAVGDLLIAVALRAVLDEAQHPLMDMLEIGVAALREGAQQVQRRGGLPVGHLDAVRVGRPALGGEGDVVDDVAAIARQLDVALALHAGGARLGELAGDAADLEDRHGAGEGEHHRHLQEDAEEIADVVGVMLGEALGAIAALEQEALPGGDARQALLELARLAGEDQRRVVRYALLDGGKRRRIGVDGRLLDRLRAPAIGFPDRLHHSRLRPAARQEIDARG